MSLPLLHSIHEITRVLNTGLLPVQVLANDLNEYVAKHSRGHIPCSRLANELLGHAYAAIWELPVLDGALLKVSPDHIGSSASNQCQPRFFHTTCFATRYRRDSTEFNAFFDQTSSYERKRFHNRHDLLKIALFDVWLANDDRTQGNPNLLVTADPEGHTIRVMDHEGIFHGNNPGRELPMLTMDDSILAHPAIRTLLGPRFKKSEFAARLEQEFYLCVEDCQQRTDEILASLPADWQVPIATFGPLVKQQLFAKDRPKAVFHHFASLLNHV